MSCMQISHVSILPSTRIGWAIHGKPASRADKVNALYGNRLDLWVRETQDKQTGGIPVGPDTSFLIAEVIASVIDEELQSAVPGVAGTRFMDDYHLYCNSAGEAAQVLAELHRIAGRYELEVNDLKTEIEELPEAIEPYWKTQLRAIPLGNSDHGTSFKAVFDRAAELAKEFPQDNVFTYVVKKIESSLQPSSQFSEWEVIDAHLLRAAVGEPSCLPSILRIFEQHNRKPSSLAVALDEICVHHARLQHAYEVAWALWVAKRLDVQLSQMSADAVETIDDDIVALVALDLQSSGLLPTPVNSFQLWAEYMKPEHLYSEHWLLAYEASMQQWLPPVGGLDFVQSDVFFGILAKFDVRFYDTSANVPEPDSGYEDDVNPDFDLDAALAEDEVGLEPRATAAF